MAPEREYKITTIGKIAAENGTSRDMLNSFLMPEHLIDMIQLGWQPMKYTLLPAVHKYIIEVVFEKKDRKGVFPNLKDLK